MECYIQWRKGFYILLVIEVCLMLFGDVIAGLDPCSKALLCEDGTQTVKYGTWRYTVKTIKNPYCTPGCVNCSTGGIGMPRNVTYNISELHPGQFFQISWGYSADVTNLRGFLIQLFLNTASECIRINHELCIFVNISTMTVDGFPAGFYLNCFYNGTPNAAIKTVVSSYPLTNTCFLEATLPSPPNNEDRLFSDSETKPTTGRAKKLTATISSIPSADTTTTIAVATVVGVLVFSIVIGIVLFFVKKGLICSTKASSRGEVEVNNIMDEAELDLEMENLKGQVEKTKKEKSLTNKILKKQKLILENNNRREIETVRSETNVTDKRSNDLGESSTSKNESYGTHSSRRLHDKDTVNDLSTPTSHVSSRKSTLAQDSISIDDLYDEYNRQLIAINMD